MKQWGMAAVAAVVLVSGGVAAAPAPVLTGNEPVQVECDSGTERLRVGIHLAKSVMAYEHTVGGELAAAGTLARPFTGYGSQSLRVESGGSYFHPQLSLVGTAVSILRLTTKQTIRLVLAPLEGGGYRLERFALKHEYLPSAPDRTPPYPATARDFPSLVGAPCTVQGL